MKMISMSISKQKKQHLAQKKQSAQSLVSIFHLQNIKMSHKDTAGTVTSTTISAQNFLCSPDFQLQTANGRIYGFANSPEKADYTTLHIYDIGNIFLLNYH